MTYLLMNDVIFAHKPRLLDVAVRLKRSTYAALGLAVNCAWEYPMQLGNGRTGLVLAVGLGGITGGRSLRSMSALLMLRQDGSSVARSV